MWEYFMLINKTFLCFCGWTQLSKCNLHFPPSIHYWCLLYINFYIKIPYTHFLSFIKNIFNLDALSSENSDYLNEFWIVKFLMKQILYLLFLLFFLIVYFQKTFEKVLEMLLIQTVNYFFMFQSVNYFSIISQSF